MPHTSGAHSVAWSRPPGSIRGVDAARAAAQLRLAALRRWRSNRADLAPGRPQRHHDHGDDLPQSWPVLIWGADAMNLIFIFPAETHDA